MRQKLLIYHAPYYPPFAPAYEYSITVESPNNGHVGDECFVHYSEVLTCIQSLAGGTQFVHCREVVRSSECPLSEVPLYIILPEILFEIATTQQVYVGINGVILPGIARSQLPAIIIVI